MLTNLNQIDHCIKNIMVNCSSCHLEFWYGCHIIWHLGKGQSFAQRDRYMKECIWSGLWYETLAMLLMLFVHIQCIDTLMTILLYKLAVICYWSSMFI